MLGPSPSPTFVLDGLFSDEALSEVLREFPDPRSPVWKEYQNYHEGKLETQSEGKIGEFTSMLLYQFNSAPFPLDRRLNVLIYLNREWKDAYGGHLELWAKDMSRCGRKILPIYNRTVIFSITDWAFHGHTEPLTCPEDMTQKSIALYYFTSGRPPGETMPGKLSTLFMQRPGEVVPAGTIFSRDQSMAAPVPAHARPFPSGMKWVVKKVTPPILIDLARYLIRSPKG